MIDTIVLLHFYTIFISYKEHNTRVPRRAAEIHDVHYRTLYRRQKGTPSRSDWIPKLRRLSNLEEQIIVEHILNLDSRGYPPRLRDIEEIANQLFANRKAPPVSKNWASNSIKRQPELKTRFQRRYDYQRAKCEGPAVIRNWFRLVKNIITKYGIRSDDIYNFDEAGFTMGMIGSGLMSGLLGKNAWLTKNEESSVQLKYPIKCWKALLCYEYMFMGI
ncbi:Uncharacterized protein HZ326_25337 [Fusarium oxysporum f. sp. albedinis]|nr:Uncharacterized protein HZ326_25337 [Fusarium oxysporum f. sp. albedinis]